jgi:hypothetical protein
MNCISILSLSLLLSTAYTSSLLAWGDSGHTAIWEVAQSRLTPKAKQWVDATLAGDKLDMTPIWLDRVRDVAKGKGGPLAEDADAKAFNAKFKYNATWHYVDLPLGAKSYAEAKEFHGYDNVVTQINACIQTLQGKADKMDARTALRVLTHLVGDIHQPMHCAAGFFDVSNPASPVLHTDPALCLPLEKDKCGDAGGNLLFFGQGSFDQLHAYWDMDAVQRVAVVGKLAPVLEKNVSAVNATVAGGLEDWAAHWATDTLAQAVKAYAGLKFGACTLSTDGGKRGKFTRIEVTLPAGYDALSKAIATEQMTKAAIRLADVINAICQ